jgi:molecular chaperone GrpE
MTWRTNNNSSEPEATKAEINSDGDTVETVAPPADPLAQLQADLKAARDEVAEWQDRFLRKAAEFENFRKRSEKEKSDAAAYAKSSVLLEFLHVADASERAFQSLADMKGATGNLQQFQQGLELLYKQLFDAFNKAGIKPIEAEGKPFDPHLHEALSREENADVKEDTVVKELRKGYLLNDRLLRPAQVIVAVHPHG